jgi:hypothetical protein
MQLCLLSLAYACLYHNPITMGHSVCNIDISKLLAHTMPYTLSAICAVQLKPGFIHEEHTSPACQWPACQWPPKVSICPLRSVTTPNCSQVKSLVRMTSFPETVSDRLYRNSSVMQTHNFISCPGVLNVHSILWQQLWWTFLQSACQLHVPSKLETSVVLCDKLNILEWPFIVPSTTCTCVMIMLLHQLLDM